MQLANVMTRPTPPPSGAEPAGSPPAASGAGSARGVRGDAVRRRAPEPAPPDPTERPIIERAQQGDSEAFRTLVEQHQQRAFRIARHLAPNDEDARDLVQEAFLRVFRGLDRFDFQYSFSTWLHRIVTNLAIDHLRKRRVQASGRVPADGQGDDEIEFDPRDPRDASPADRLDALETGRKVRECIAALAPHFQSVLMLREIEGMACTDIAKIVGATHVTVRWRLHRGRKLFQEEWERRERLEDAGRDSLARGADPLQGGANEENESSNGRASTERGG